MRYLFLSLSLIIGLYTTAKNKITLDPQVKSSYLELLEQAPKFHSALKKQDKQALEIEIKQTQEIIAGFYQKNSPHLKFHHRIHSYKLLSKLEEQLNSLESQNKPNKKNIKNLFHSFFELANVYDLSKEMKGSLFYCDKDKSHWIQSDSTAYNPINSNHSSCGRTIL